MGLSTDSIFIAAISSNQELMEVLGKTSKKAARLYPTAIPMPDEQADNVPLPFVIVTFDNLDNDQTTKDDPYESDSDQVNIGVIVAARNRKELGELTQTIRKTVHTYMQENQTAVEDYTFGAKSIIYDPQKPCYWQTLVYQCDVNNLTDNDDEQD